MGISRTLFSAVLFEEDCKIRHTAHWTQKMNVYLLARRRYLLITDISSGNRFFLWMKNCSPAFLIISRTFFLCNKMVIRFYGVLGLGYKQTEALCIFFQFVSSDVAFNYYTQRYNDDARYGDDLREIVQKDPPGAVHHRRTH